MKTEKKTAAFPDVVKAYNADPNDVTALYDMSTAIAYAVLKKVISTTANPVLNTIRRELTRDRADLANLQYSNDNATRIAFNVDGDMTIEVVDPDLVTAAAKKAALPLGDGLDLVHTAVVTILEETAAQRDRDPDLAVDMERPYCKRVLRKRVYIKDETAASNWEDVTTTPIQEAYKAVRRAIDASRAAQVDPRNGYTYIEDLATDEETNATETIYRRMDKYADLGGSVHDYNGKETAATTASAAAVDDLKAADRVVASLELTDRQAVVLKYRRQGFGYKAIATRLNVTQRAIAKTAAQIQTKAAAHGLKAENTPAPHVCPVVTLPDPVAAVYCGPHFKYEYTPAPYTNEEKKTPATPAPVAAVVNPVLDVRDPNAAALAHWLACPVYHHVTIEDHEEKRLARWLACPVYHHVTIEDRAAAAIVVNNSRRAAFIAEHGQAVYDRCVRIYG